jgi:hypothetical protein
MDKKDRLIADLVNALDLIRREASKPDARRHYIEGAASFAIKHVEDASERNADGYLVVKG